MDFCVLNAFRGGRERAEKRENCYYCWFIKNVRNLTMKKKIGIAENGWKWLKKEQNWIVHINFRSIISFYVKRKENHISVPNFSESFSFYHLSFSWKWMRCQKIRKRIHRKKTENLKRKHEVLGEPQNVSNGKLYQDFHVIMCLIIHFSWIK